MVAFKSVGSLLPNETHISNECLKDTKNGGIREICVWCIRRMKSENKVRV